MLTVLKNARVYRNGQFETANVFVNDGIVTAVSQALPAEEDARILDFKNHIIIPGLVDVHVHLREPGFCYKENIETGTKAAARGGYTAVCAMPNLNPVPDSVEHLQEELKAINESAVIKVYPYGAITIGELGETMADLNGMADKVIAFSDDGKGVQSADMMEEAMKIAKSHGKLIAAHCEDNALLFGGYIHDGEYAKAHGHKGICSESEWGPIARDIELIKKTGVSYHVCHVSAKESVEIIRKAKAEGVDITCETGPHYLVMNDSMLKEEGRFKMNPPIRSEADRLALIEGILDGTVDMIATDHAPHSAEEKGKGLAGSAMGIVGLETAFTVLYTKLVKGGILSLEALIRLMHDNPKARFGIGSEIEVGEKADLAVFELDHEYEIDPETFLSMGKATPFAGEKVFGKCVMTICDGNVVWQEGTF